MEVLIAMGIFFIAMVAIAAIFPAAAILQKQSLDAAGAEQVADNVEALLTGRKWLETDLLDTIKMEDNFFVNGTVDVDEDGQVHRFKPNSGLSDAWSLKDRASPSTSADSNGLGGSFYWVPLVQNRVPGGPGRIWRIFVFILKSDTDENYDRTNHAASEWANPDDGFIAADLNHPDTWRVPGVVRIGVTVQYYDTFNVPGNATNKYIKAGDWILDNEGGLYQVRSINEDNGNRVTIRGVIAGAPIALWIGMPLDADSPSPCKRIITLSDAVE